MRASSLALDLAVVVTFAITGRLSHDLGIDPLGIAATAWPFAVGLLLGWIVAAQAGWALRSLRAGLAVWALTLVAGMGLRVLTREGTAGAFVLVATGVLGLGMLGWRVVVAVLGNGSVPGSTIRDEESPDE